MQLQILAEAAAAAVLAHAPAPLVLAHAILLFHCANFAQSVAATGFPLFPLPLMLADVATATLFTITSGGD